MIVKTIKFDKGIVNIHDEYIPKNQNEEKLKLKSIYDMFNFISRNSKTKGIDIDDWFYSREELKKIEKMKEYEFI